MSIVPAPVYSAEDTYDVMPRAMELAQQLAPTEFVPRALRNRPEAVLAAILTGREIGLPAMQSLAQIAIIDGRPALAAQAARTLILRRGHQLWAEESTITRCVLCGQRRGEDRVHKATWTIDDAQRAGLSGRDNWRRYPRAMLLARATAELSRLAFADVLGGLAYMAEEVADGGFSDDGPAAAPPAPEPQAPGRTVRRRARRRTERAEGAEPDEPQVNTRTDGSQDTPPVGSAGSVPPPPPEPARPEAPMPEPPPARGEETAGEVRITERMTLAQQIAMTAKEAGVDWRQLVRAVTGKARARDVTREEALRVLSAARDVQGGRVRLMEENGNYFLAEVVEGPPEEEQ